MTNLEFIKTLDKEEIADYYCYLHDIGGRDCRDCPFRDDCYEEGSHGRSGIRNWLDKEHKVDEKGW